MVHLSENDDVSVPKIPPFDYSPPPYSGPSLDEIFKKRKEFLSPSMFYFYKKPVRFYILNFSLDLFNRVFFTVLGI